MWSPNRIVFIASVEITYDRQKAIDVGQKKKKKRSRIWIKSSKRFGIISALPKVQFTVHAKQTGLSQEKKEIQNWNDAGIAALKMIDDLPTLKTTASEENCNFY